MSASADGGLTEAQLAAQAHQELVRQLDMHNTHKLFRNPHWRPNQRRNKNLKTILGDVSKREAATSAAATPADESGVATPAEDNGLSTSGTSTPATGSGKEGSGGPIGIGLGLAQASRSLSKLVLEKSLRPGAGVANGGAGGGSLMVGGGTGPTATYTNIESAPSLSCNKHYCDVTGLPAPYLDPKTRLRYHNKEVFALIRGLPQGTTEQYLEARGAHTVLK